MIQYVSSEKRLVFLFFSVILGIFLFLTICALSVIMFFNDNVNMKNVMIFAAIFFFNLFLVIFLDFTTFRFWKNGDKIIFRDIFGLWEIDYQISKLRIIDSSNRKILKMRANRRTWIVDLNEDKRAFFLEQFPQVYQ